MTTYFLKFILESDAAFGRGDGVAGVVDAEVQHDEYGCPFLGGRSLKGLLVRECAEVRAALPQATKSRWEEAARSLFGNPGSGQADTAILFIGDAQLPADLRAAIARDVQAGQIKREEVLESLTAIRRQTAMTDEGVPKPHALRAIRVILRQTPFEAILQFAEEPSMDNLALLAACIKAFRRAGGGINRGLGRLRADLLDASGQCVTDKYFEIFREAVIL